MAKRIRKTRITEDWKNRIRVGMLLERLQKHASGTLEMSSTQIKAAEILLRKSMPDLSASDNKHAATVAICALTPEQEKAGLEMIMRYQLKHKDN